MPEFLYNCIYYTTKYINTEYHCCRLKKTAWWGVSMYDFGLRLKKLRKSRGLTQKMLADRINKSVSAVSSYESNAQLPPLYVSKSIALALGISIDYLVGNEEPPAYTAKNLTEYQAELLDELISEFHSPTNRSPQLSEQQLQILQKLIAIFTDVG